MLQRGAAGGAPGAAGGLAAGGYRCGVRGRAGAQEGGALSWFRIELHRDGSVKTCAPCDAPAAVHAGSRVFFAQGATATEAQKQAKALFNSYFAEKTKAARAKRKADGKCRCGRPRDRKHPVGGFWQQCRVCAARQDVYRERYETPVAKPARNEVAKAEECTSRVRDRKAEMRLEVLVEVQEAWESASNNQAFTRWLRAELAKALAPRTAEAAE